MKRVLIIYEIIGFATKLFDLAVTDDQYDKIMKCQGHYINGDDWTPECEWLTEFLDVYTPVYNTEDRYGQFIPYKPAHKYDLVVFTGFIS